MLISLDEALALIVAEAHPLADELVQLSAAHGRVLAADLIARSDAPRTTVSAMDGYAVRDADLAALPVRLPVTQRIFAGARDAGSLEPGTCARIFTGAPVPAGADRIVVQEIVRAEGDLAVFETAPGTGRHIRAAGSDFARGQVLLPAGRRLDARAMVAAAAADQRTVPVRHRPRVVVLGTGDELAEPGQALETPGAIAESVSFGVAGLVAEWGGDTVARRRLSDDPATLAEAARDALRQAEVVVVTGGASVGERDFARDMFAGTGMEMIFSKVAIKPGKPVWFARAEGRLILGLPGNPTSAMVTARLLLAPLLAGLSGRDPRVALDWHEAELATPLAATGDRETLERGQLIDGKVSGLRDQDSGAQRALADATILIRRRPLDPAAERGAMVTILDF